MKTIYILGYNNLGADFWEKHLDFNSDVRVLFFKDGTALLKHTKNNPDIIVVDDYFCNEPPKNHSFSDLQIGLSLRCAYTPTFFFSPRFSGKARKSSKYPHYYSCLDEDMLNFLNKKMYLLTQESIAA